MCSSPLWLLLTLLGYVTIYCSADLTEVTDLDHLPMSGFTCEDKVIGGYYADIESGCQMFHVCTFGQNEEIIDIKFLCLSGTVFDQKTRVCERVDEVDCSQSTNYYNLNLKLFGQQNETEVSTQDREQPDGDYVLDDQNQHFSSQSIEIDYDDYDFSGPTSRLETTSMIPIILVTASPTTSPPPFTTSTSTQGMIFALPTPPPDQTPTPFPELLNDDTMHLVQIPIASNPNTAVEVSTAIAGPKTEIWSPIDSRTGHRSAIQIEEDEEIIGLLEQIEADVPRISSIRFHHPRTRRSVKVNAEENLTTHSSVRWASFSIK